jgi:large subunit ribosomal protein L30
MNGTGTEYAHKTIQIKWVRSGIGFTRQQKKMVRSLGLLRLNQIVARPDTPQIRGLVESIPHLVKIVSAPERPAWMSVPEYTIYPPSPEEIAAARESKKKKPAKVSEPAAEPVVAEPVAEEQAKPEEVGAKPAAKAKKPAKAAAAKSKAAKGAAAQKPKKAEKPSKATKKTRK